jgi:hypothetical protein
MRPVPWRSLMGVLRWALIVWGLGMPIGALSGQTPLPMSVTGEASHRGESLRHTDLDSPAGEQPPQPRDTAQGASSAEEPHIGTAPSFPLPPPYQPLRYDEDYRYLRDPQRRSDVWDPLKYLPLNEAGDWYASLGGELRERYEFSHNPRFGQEPHDAHGNNNYLLQRYMLHADLHLGPFVRLFGQLKSGLEHGRIGGPRPADEDRLDLHQAFLDVVAPLQAEDALTLRAGRQEMAFGSQRLVSVREGPNVRQSFDGLRTLLRAEAWRIDAFVTRPVETNRGVFDDNPDPRRTFWGIYAVHPFGLVPQGHIDLYYLGLVRQDARFDQGIADERRHSIGLRLWGAPEPWDYNFEFVYQFGRFGDGEIQAWTAASDTGYTLPSLPWRPRLGLKADIASGDRNPASRSLQTFNPLFPKGAYFNEADLIGPANFIDLHPTLDLHVSHGLTVGADWDVFWRESVHDGLYGVAVNLIRSGSSNRARYIGSALSAQVAWAATRHLTLVTTYTHFFPGPFVTETQPGKAVEFVATWISYKF